MRRKRNEAPRPVVVVGAKTDVGCVRSQNEDSLLNALPLLVVCDGIGGQEAGEVASQIAIEVMDDEAPRNADAVALGEAVVSANKAVMDGVERGRGLPGMGTTLTAAVIEGDKMIVAQVGDSRAYRLRDGKLEQLTHDHSLIAAMIESGQVTEEEARTHPSRSIITRALGSDPDMHPDLFEFDLKRGDRILLCSDGLHGMVENAQIESTLNVVNDPQICANTLIEMAKEAGGLDNVTAIVANINDIAPAEVEQIGPKKHRYSALLFTIVALLLVFCAVGGFWYYVKNSAYLISENGYVALYNGRNETFAGIDLGHYGYTTDVAVEKLPEITSQKLSEGIQFDSVGAAESVIKDYEAQIAVDSQDEAQQTQTTTAVGSDKQARTTN